MSVSFTCNILKEIRTLFCGIQNLRLIKNGACFNQYTNLDLGLRSILLRTGALGTPGMTQKQNAQVGKFQNLD
jgi:hypothetical protein